MFKAGCLLWEEARLLSFRLAVDKSEFSLSRSITFKNWVSRDFFLRIEADGSCLELLLFLEVVGWFLRRMSFISKAFNSISSWYYCSLYFSLSRYLLILNMLRVSYSKSIITDTKTVPI